MENKLHFFEYVLFKLSEWYKSENEINTWQEFNCQNDLNKLKVIKISKNNFVNFVEGIFYLDINAINIFL